MDTTHGLAAILRDARKGALPGDEVGDIFTSSQDEAGDFFTGSQDEVGGFRSHTGGRDGGGAKVELLGLRRPSTGIATQRCEPAK